tara:strand:+ start:7168 stop:7629 length:462 start_codon:yes stop_codon:yes gene_type:complete
MYAVGFRGEVMKVGAGRQIGQTTGKRASSVRSAGSGFVVGAAEGGRGVAGLNAASSLAAVDSLLALQEAGGLEDATSSPRRAMARGEQMLDILDDIKLSLLAGQVPEMKLTRLLKVVEEQQAQVRDPALGDILDHIELRARVELAKFGTFAKG